MKSRILNFLHRSYIFIIILLIYIPLITVVVLSFTQPSDKGNLNLNFVFNDGKN